MTPHSPYTISTSDLNNPLLDQQIHNLAFMLKNLAGGSHEDEETVSIPYSGSFKDWLSFNVNTDFGSEGNTLTGIQLLNTLLTSIMMPQVFIGGHAASKEAVDVNFQDHYAELESNDVLAVSYYEMFWTLDAINRFNMVATTQAEEQRLDENEHDNGYFIPISVPPESYVNSIVDAFGEISFEAMECCYVVTDTLDNTMVESMQYNLLWRQQEALYEIIEAGQFGEDLQEIIDDMGPPKPPDQSQVDEGKLAANTIGHGHAARPERYNSILDLLYQEHTQ